MESIHISFNLETLQTRGVTVDGLKYYMDCLSKLLKDRFSEVVPTQISDTASLDRILTLHEVLSGISEISGSDRHFRIYTESQFLSTLFVSRLALFLKDKVDEIELEPITSDDEGNPDLRIVKNNHTAYIECKNIETSKFNNLEEHRRIFELIENHIKVPHQISISYKSTPNEEQINTLGAGIAHLLNNVSTTGNIINNEEYEINVQIREGYGDPRLTGVMEMIMEDMNSGVRKPGHVFFEKGKTIAIHGPDIDYKKTLQAKVKDAKNQHVPGAIFITAINSDLILGSSKDNIRHIEAMFQPNQNTRYSSVILANSQTLSGEGRWQTITNPYALVPLVDDIDRIFRN